MDLVRTGKGLIRGVERDGYAVFFGMPYAQPPVGPLRWRPPREAEAWEGELQATRFPARCPQGGHDGFYGREFYDEPVYETEMSEDCLYLNVWTPARSAGERLPVAFWIHGGAFMGGYGHEKEFDGEAYCRRGVILVTVNYRLGPLGFLAHPWLTAESAAAGGPAVSGNYGILDQMAALRWVRENIAAFGGDPERVTVFGQSAGCMSVQTLVSSPLTRGMIAGAILQSGVGLSYDHGLARAEAEGLEFARNAGVRDLDAMRALRYDEIMAAAGPIIARGYATMELPYAPVIDGYVLMEGYTAAMEAGRVHDIPYMVGSTLNDITTDPAALAAGDRGAVYGGSEAWCAARRAHGGPAWLYWFTRPLPGDDAGAFHSAELWYMFGTWKRAWRPFTAADGALSDRMLDYWTNFTRTGDPNGPGLPPWKAYGDGGDIMVLDI